MVRKIKSGLVILLSAILVTGTPAAVLADETEDTKISVNEAAPENAVKEETAEGAQEDVPAVATVEEEVTESKEEDVPAVALVEEEVTESSEEDVPTVVPAEEETAAEASVPVPEADIQETEPLENAAGAYEEPEQAVGDSLETVSEAGGAEIAAAATFSGSGDCGAPDSKVTWSITGDETNLSLTFSGTGAIQNMEDHTGSQPWSHSLTTMNGKWHNIETYKVVIGEGITTIGENTFYDTYVTSVKMPSSLREVKMNAFVACRKLTEVKFPEGVTTLGYGLFGGSDNIENVSIPSTVTSIDKFCFVNALGIKTIHFAGTQAKWKEVFKGTLREGITVSCSDGSIDSGSGGSGGSEGSGSGGSGDSGSSGSDGSVSENVTPLTGTGYVAKQKTDVSELFKSKYGKTYDKYTVSPKGYASINSSGVLTAKKAGKITITGYTKEGKKYVADTGHTIEINIEKPAFKQKTLTATRAGVTIDAAGNIKDSTIAPSSWTSSKAAVATVDAATGLVTTVGKGSTKITAVYGSGKEASKYSFTVKVTPPVISKKAATVLTGAGLKLKLKNTKLTPVWKSSDETKATVDTSGKVSVLEAGSTPVEITATVEGADYTCLLTIKPPVIKKQAITIKAGKSGKVGLKSTKLKTIEWTSSDTSVATVDSTGKVQALNAGTAVISTTTGGVENKCTVTVR